jgi:DNA modification methylase
MDLKALQSEEGLEVAPGVRVRLRSLADYRQNEENPVSHTPRNLGAIVESVQKVGAARSGLAADGTIYAGNLTSEAMAIAGIEGIVEVTTDGTKWVMVNRPDLTPEQRKQAAHADQWSAMLAEINVDQLLVDIEAGIDLDGIYSEFDLRDILGEALVGVETGEAPEAQIDKGAELAEHYGVEVGQVWQLGEHRLAVGDCTDKAVVDAVMKDEVIDLVIIDPPYSVDYGAKNRALQTIGPSNRLESDIAGDTLTTDETANTIWGPAFENAYIKSRNGTVIYCFAPQGGDQMMMMMMMKAKWNERLHQLIWRKNAPTFSMGRLDYQYQHEPILYSWRGTNHGFYGDIGRSVIDCDRPSSSKLHPTMKPIELIELFIANSSRSNEIVYDSFVGSGTTLIACERLNRKCRAIEIEPKYCAVTIQRWVDLTGLEPKLL